MWAKEKKKKDQNNFKHNSFYYIQQFDFKITQKIARTIKFNI